MWEAPANGGIYGHASSRLGEVELWANVGTETDLCMPFPWSSRSTLSWREAVPVVPDNTSALRPPMTAEEPYLPAFQDQPLFDKLSAGGLHLLTAVRGELSGCGFKIPDLAAVLEGKTDRPWIVEIHVDLGSDGRVNHAFLMTGSQDAELNAKLVRRMYFAEAMAVDRECSGRVVISCGRR